MKNFCALLLSLLLLLPIAALGEAETRIVEFDDFTLTVGPNDILMMGDETDPSELFVLFPDYNDAADSHPNIIASMSPMVLSGFSNDQAEAFCRGLMQSCTQDLTSKGVIVSNEQLVLAEHDAETGAVTALFTLDADVTALGLDQKTTVCMGCRFLPMGDQGSYVFTLGCKTVEEAGMLIDVLNSRLAIRK